MGCFDYVCGLTDYPIKSGDKVKLFIIVEQTNRLKPAIYPTEMYAPCSFGLDVTYDNYGGFNLVDTSDVFAALVLESLKKTFKYSGDEDLNEKSDFNAFSSAIGRGDVSLGGYGAGKVCFYPI